LDPGFQVSCCKDHGLGAAAAGWQTPLAACGLQSGSYDTMTEESAKKSKLSWSKSLVRKWFNIRPKAQDFHADSDAGQGRDGGSGSWRPSCSAGEASASMAKKSRTAPLFCHVK